MDRLLEIPVFVRLAGLALFGFVLGGQLNRGIYRLAWNPRHVGPWSPPLPEAPRRSAWDRVPLLGWFLLRRESPLHGRGYWVRPLLIELATGFGLAWLYYFEVIRGSLLPPEWPPGVPADAAVLHAGYLSHVLLVALMIVATFIDFDEQTIPDEITLPGTLAGLLLAGLLPASRPVVMVASGYSDRWQPVFESLHLATPLAWPAWLNGRWGLALGLAAFVAWWLAVLPWTWTLRRGVCKAIGYAWTSVARRLSIVLVALGATGVAVVSLVWLWGGSHWEGLFSALVGMVFGGGLIWSVRIVGTFALRQEAMGFGDVTLMAMIGAFIGWQGTLIVFFLAPFAAVLISVTQWVLTRRKDIAFGPYLCLGALFLILRWPRIWSKYASDMFSLGWFIPAIVVACLGLMGGMLIGLRTVRESFSRYDEPDEETPGEDVPPSG